MTTFAEISQQPDGYRTLPQVPRDAVQLLWHSDFWDGPKSGMLAYKDERCWFEVIAENEDEDLTDWYRKFVIIRLTAEQLAEKVRWHELFRENVGWHTDYRNEPGRYEGLCPQEQRRAFYEPYQKRVPIDLTDNEVLAWFEH